MTALENILSRVPDARQIGDNWSARCPAHDDRNPSLSIGPGGNGKVLLKCHAGCDTEAIANAWGIPMSDLFPPREEPPSPLTVAALAADKGIPADFLRELGVKDAAGGVQVTYRLMDGTDAPRQRLRKTLTAKSGSLWMKGTGSPVAYGLERVQDGREEGYIVLVEGESDCWTLWMHGIPAIGLPGSDTSSKILPEYLLGIPLIYYWREPDLSGDTFSKGIKNRLLKIGYEGEVREVRGNGVKDPCDLFREQGERFEKVFQSNLSESVKILPEEEVPFPKGFQDETEPPPLDTSKGHLDVRRGNKIDMVPHTYHWDDRLPLGKLIVLAGDGGQGKSQIGLSLAATLSTGGTWADGTRAPIAETLICSFEDDPDDTSCPRIALAGGDLSKVHFLDTVTNPDGTPEQLNLAKHIPLVEGFLVSNPKIKFVIIDPISSCLGTGTDSHKDASVRGVLGPLSKVANKHKVTMLAIGHFSKESGSTPLKKVAGSIAFGNAPRGVFVTCFDPEDEEPDPNKRRRLFLHAKNNIGILTPGFAYTIEEGLIPGRDEKLIKASKIAWGEETGISAAEAFTDDKDGKSGKLDRAKDFLNKILMSGPALREDIFTWGEDQGIKEGTLRRAQREMADIESDREGFGGPARWRKLGYGNKQGQLPENGTSL